MLDGLALKTDVTTVSTLAALAKCMADPTALRKLNTAFAEKMFGDWLVNEAMRRRLACEDLRKKGLPHDFVINGYRVQAKSGAGLNGRIDCTPVRPYKATPHIRRYPISAIDVMAVCLLSSFEVFFVPTKFFACPKYPGMVRGSFLRKKHCEWIDAWHVLDGTPGVTPSQRELFANMSSHTGGDTLTRCSVK